MKPAVCLDYCFTFCSSGFYCRFYHQLQVVGVTDQRLYSDLWPPPHAGVYMCDVVRPSRIYTHDQLIGFRHDDPPDEAVRARIRLLFRRHRGCRAAGTGNVDSNRAADGADGGHTPIITSDRSSSRPPRSPPTTGRCLTRTQRARKPIRLGCMNIRSLPTLYVFNAAAVQAACCPTFSGRSRQYRRFGCRYY